jgi:hypothetical protein
LFFVDASTDRVGLGTSSPGATADIYAAGSGIKNILNIRSSLDAISDGGAITFSNTTPASFQLAKIASVFEGGTYQGSLRFYTNTDTEGASPSEKMRITPAGRVGIGTTSPSAPLHVKSTNPQVIVDSPDASTESRVRWYKNGSSVGDISSASGNIKITSESALLFLANGGAGGITEHARIDTSGRLLVGTTTTLGGSGALIQAASSVNTLFLQSSNAATDILALYSTPTSGDNIFVNFGTEASFTSRGTIDYNRAAGQVRYNVTSDRRLKSDIQDAGSALSILNQIKVRSYTWAETGYGVEYGFIAQELNEAVPDAVKVGDDGEEVVDTWAVDNAKLVPVLTKALQEAIANIETLEAKVAALEGA